MKYPKEFYEHDYTASKAYTIRGAIPACPLDGEHLPTGIGFVICPKCSKGYFIWKKRDEWVVRSGDA